jgi:hypothetical protein
VNANPNLVEMSAGYSVEVLGRTGLRYVEGERTMLVDSEVVGGPAIAMYAASMKRWEPPHDSEPLDDRERTRIIENIQRACDSKGWTLRVTWPFGERKPDGPWRWSSEGKPIKPRDQASE